MEEEQITGTETEPTEEIEQDPVPAENDQEIIEQTQAAEDYQQFYSDQLELTNHILTGQVFFMGLIFGVILFKIFWDRWKV